jgi:hypothetical protein
MSELEPNPEMKLTTQSVWRLRARRRDPTRCGLFAQVVMLAQLYSDRVGHDLAAVNLRRLAPVYHGAPSRLGIGVDCHH